MISFLVSLALAGLALLAIAFRKTYGIVPPKELKRQARAGDGLAKVLYRAVAYGASLSLLLWLITVAAVTASFVIMSAIVPPFLAFVLEVLILGYGFAWMPSGDVTQIGVRIVVWLTPAITWLLSHLQPVMGRIATFVASHRPVTVHTGLYEREDLLNLLEKQKAQADSRFSTEELSLLSHALQYSQKVVSDVMVPRRAVRLVRVDDSIGPIMMGELHDSGHSRFPVFEGDEDHIVGTLFLRDLVNASKGGHVRSIMDASVFYVHEDYTLEQALHAFLKTKRHMFIVINNFEEFVGIITIEDILEQVIGHQIIDEFDHYDDMRAVATHQAEKEHDRHKKAGETVAETNTHQN
jgi:CBS domain containing-hemolysin-like protein